MRIAVIGAGAMGSIYGGHLSLKHEVYLVDTNKEVVEAINQNGLQIEENGRINQYHPRAVLETSALGHMDLVILFVKALYSENALRGNACLIGKNTYIMTLQNGSGHDEILSKFIPKEHIIIGTTEDNGAALGKGKIRHGGRGRTNIGLLDNREERMISQVKAALDECGFDTRIHDHIQYLIWEKLFTNVSLSAVTGILQCKMGYISSNLHAFHMAEQLILEAVKVAGALGLTFDEKEILKKVRETSEQSPEGITSICADLKAGRKTEADTISGYVVKAAARCGISVPTHAFVLEMIHAMEEHH